MNGHVTVAADNPYFKVVETEIIDGKPLRVLELSDRLFPVN